MGYRTDRDDDTQGADSLNRIRRRWHSRTMDVVPENHATLSLNCTTIIFPILKEKPDLKTDILNYNILKEQDIMPATNEIIHALLLVTSEVLVFKLEARITCWFWNYISHPVLRIGTELC